jgi:type I restriction enzyme M protein
LVWPKEDFDYLKGKRRFKSDLLSKSILIDHYFSLDQKNIESLQGELSKIEIDIQEIIDENSGEEGLLEDIIEGEADKQKINLKSLKTHLKEINNDPNFKEETWLLNKCLELLEKQTNIKNKIKISSNNLNTKIEKKYPKLKENEIKALVIENKWFNSLSITVLNELNYISQKLTSRVKELAERYAIPLPKLNNDLEKISAKVNEHLKEINNNQE